MLIGQQPARLQRKPTVGRLMTFRTAWAPDSTGRPWFWLQCRYVDTDEVEDGTEIFPTHAGAVRLARRIWKGETMGSEVEPVAAAGLPIFAWVARDAFVAEVEVRAVGLDGLRFVQAHARDVDGLEWIVAEADTLAKVMLAVDALLGEGDDRLRIEAAVAS